MSLVRTGFIPVPAGSRPGFDHADINRSTGRMFVAPTGGDLMDVIDCRTRSYLRSIPDLPGVAGVLIDEEHDLLFTSDRDAARVSVFCCSDEKLLGRVDVGPHPNRLAYDGPAADCWPSTWASPSAVVMRDPRLAVLYVAVGEPGVVCSFDSEKLELRQTVETESGAHTIGSDPDGRSLYVFCPTSVGALIFEEHA